MNRIKQLRMERGITQAELAEILNISPRAVGYYENEEREPDYDTLTKIAEYFDVSIDYLLGNRTGVKDVTDEMVQKELEKRGLLNDSTFNIGLSREEEGLLQEEDKQQIRDFAKFVVNKRKEEK